MCYNNSNNIKRKSADIEPRFYANTTCITRRSFVKYIKGQPREDYNPSWPKPHAIPYPKPNIYYPFTEDTNPFERVNVSDDGELIFKSQRFDPPKEPYESRDPYSDVGATAKYLDTKPTCFAIFSKPGLNTSKLAGMMADALNCVLISAMPLIRREIELQTEEGVRIKQILESGGFLGHDIVMSLIRSRLKMRDVRHKGYVVEGLPLIPNENLDFSSYLNDTNDSCPCADSSTCEAQAKSAPYEDEIPKQVDEIFKEWCMPPSVIIYVASPDEDIIEKRKYLRLDVSNGDIVDTTLTEMSANLERLISQTDIVNVGPISFNPYEELMNEERILDQDREKHLVKRVADARTCNIEEQCHVYKQIALPVINKWILLYNPENVIRVDGRTPNSQMLQIINARLRLLPIPRVIMPHKMLGENEVELGGESAEAIIENEFEDMSMEEVYRELTLRGTINPRFPWRLSPFSYLCPVEQALGRTVDGFSKYAIRFLDKIYFLSSQRAMDLFMENPRPFLLPPYPRPVCKIVVFGPIYSGKSVLCRELSRTFGGTVINVKEKEQSIVDERQNAKVTLAMREKLDGVLSDLKHSLESERKRKESKRQIELQSWYERMIPVVTRLFDLLDENGTSSDTPDSEDEESSNQNELESLRETLKLFELENIEKNLSLQIEIREDNKVLLNYAPEYLAVEEPPVRELTEYDPEVLDILEDRVKYLYDEPINLSISEKADVIIESINNVAGEKIDENLLRDPCYIVDGMYTDVEVWKKVIDSNIIFEHAIVLLDQDPFAYLISKFKGYNENLPGNEDVESSDENSNNETESKRKVMTIAEYIDHLKQFDSHWKLLENEVKITVKNCIICDLPDLDDISQYVVSEMEKPFTAKATIIRDEDKERNKEFYEFENLPIGAEEDLEEGSGEKDLKSEDNSKENYPLGESGIYCPVALIKHNVYWKGSEDFSVSYMDKIYLLSTEEAMEEFVKNPQEFSIPFSSPARTIPPLRISVVGPPGSGKSTLCNSISREYGMAHVDYYDGFTKYIKSRAMPYFTLKDTLVVKEVPEEAELPEDLDDRSYNVDSRTVRYFVRQYWENGGTLPDKMLKECLLDFFRPPFHTRRVIFNGFPSCAEDASVAFKKFAVPEVVIELRCSIESCIERMVPFVMEYWDMKEEEKRQLEQQKHAKAVEEYMLRREIWIRKMLEEEEDQKRMVESEEQDMEHMDIDDPEITVKKMSSALLKQFLSEEVNLNFDVDDETILELVDLWKSENPEPEFIFDSEDSEDVKERVTSRLQVLYNNETAKLEGTRTTFEGEAIPWIEIDGEKDSDEVRMEVMAILDPYVFRNASMLERSYTVDCELAERLLDHGYYLLSSFGRWCPVQLYNQENPAQMFLPLEVQHEIWPVIYRQHIYFLGGKEAETAFRKNPLKYLEQDSCSPIIPLRISIIGPPKCGKSTLAKRFRRKYGMKIMTRGSALRGVLKRFSWTNLAEVIQSHLQAGHTVPDEYVIRAVEMFSMDPRAVSQGLLFDGFPSNRKEVELLTFRGLQPMVVLDLNADLPFCLECLSYTSDDRRCPPTFSAAFFTKRYTAWKAEEENYRTWLQKYSKNVMKLDATKSKAYTWARAEESVLRRFASLKLYFRECDYEKVQSLEFMCVSPYEFRKRQSQYEAFCPLCLMLENAFVASGPRPEAQGMVQFREHFYWICSNHLSHFHRDPLRYLPPNNTTRLPEDRPRIVDGNVDLECICWGSRLQAEGYCLVTYVDSLPRRRMVPGKTTLGVSYKSKLYLFCTPECREKFLMYCSKYADAKPKVISALPAINIWKLPDLGFLEQTVADILIQALNEISVLRPKIPGLSPAASAAIYIGAFLKVHNTSCRLQEIDIYEAVNQRMMCHTQILKHATKKMKKKVNPFVHLPHYSTNHREEMSQYSQVSSKMINMIKFRRTSPTQLLVDPDDDPDY